MKDIVISVCLPQPPKESNCYLKAPIIKNIYFRNYIDNAVRYINYKVFEYNMEYEEYPEVVLCGWKIFSSLYYELNDPYKISDIKHHIKVPINHKEDIQCIMVSDMGDNDIKLIGNGINEISKYYGWR